MMEFGKAIRQLRRNRDWTQKQLADGICSQSLLSRIEKGIENPSVFVIFHLCQKLGITLDELLHKEEFSSPFLKLKTELFSLYRQNDFETIYTLLHKKNFSLFEAYHETHYYNFFLGVSELVYKQNEKAAQIYLSQAETQKGEKLFTTLIKSYLAKIYAKQNEEVLTLETLNACLNQLNQATSHEKQNRLMPNIYHNLCMTYLFLNQPKQAILYVNLGIECCKAQQNTYQLVLLIFRSGQIFMHLGRKKIGMKRMSAAIDLSEHIDPSLTEKLGYEKQNWRKICEYA